MGRHSPDIENQHRSEMAAIKQSLLSEAKTSSVLNTLLSPAISLINRYAGDSLLEAISTLEALDQAKNRLERDTPLLIGEWNRKNGQTSKLASPQLQKTIFKVRKELNEAWLKIMMHFSKEIAFDHKTGAYSII